MSRTVDDLRELLLRLWEAALEAFKHYMEEKKK